jgi:hypothetical protein
MKDLFKDIFNIDNVQGVMFIPIKGKLVFSEFVSQQPKKIGDINWPPFIQTLNGIHEAELIFENNRFYLRRAGMGYILVVMGEAGLTEMVRLNCDVLISSFKQTKKKHKGSEFFFKKK